MTDKHENEDLEFRVDRDKRCLEYGSINLQTVRCTRKENHEGKHVCQLSGGHVLGKF